MVRKRISLTSAAVIVFFVILLAQVSIRLTGTGSHFFNPIGSVLREVLAPLQSGVMSFSRGVRDTASSVWHFGELKQENHDLNVKVQELTRQNTELKQKVLAGMRYQEMEKKFDAPAIWNKQYLGATVINRNPSNWYYSIVVNRGKQHGVKVNDAVMTNLGLVGKVISVTPNTAEVVLILDIEGQVSGLVRQSDGTASAGVVTGNYKRGPMGPKGTLKMTVPKDDRVNPGDLVLTSGMGGIYPSDIPIGTVVDITPESGGLLKTTTISPAVDFDHLEQVFVVLDGGN